MLGMLASGWAVLGLTFAGMYAVIAITCALAF
jgi:hypothetical protein